MLLYIDSLHRSGILQSLYGGCYEPRIVSYAVAPSTDPKTLKKSVDIKQEKFHYQDMSQLCVWIAGMYIYSHILYTFA